MRLKVNGYGELEIHGLTPAGLPALRLVQFHSPEIVIRCQNGKDSIQVRLGDIDLAPSFKEGKPQPPARSAAAPNGEEREG